jgi:splicing factor 3B subunit 3
VAGADKFGNVFVVRLPPDVKDDVEEDPTGDKSLWVRGLLNGASQKSDTINIYHIGETVLSLQKASLIPGGSESLVYTTLSGGVGMLVPFTSREDIEFFQHLEMHMRQEYPPLCGRDHLWYRSSYGPVKNVVDGDLCEQFNSLDFAKRKTIAEELDRTSAEVSKKLEDIRTRFAFLFDLFKDKNFGVIEMDLHSFRDHLLRSLYFYIVPKRPCAVDDIGK